MTLKGKSLQNLYDRYFAGLTQKKGFQPVYCPFHEDKGTKSAAVDIYTGVFICHKCDLKLSAAKFLAKKKELSLQEAVEEIEMLAPELDKEVKLATSISIDPMLEELWRRAQGNEPFEWEDDYARSRNLDLSTVEVGRLTADETHWRYDSLVFADIYNGRVVGLGLRRQDGRKSYEPGSCQVLWGVDNLCDKPAVIVEGRSDRIRLMGELPGFTVVSTPGVGFRKEWKREFADCSQVILLPQVDEAGERLVTSCEGVFGSRLIVQRPTFRKGQTGNDWCDWLRYNNAEQLRKDLQILVRVGSKRAVTGRDLDAEPEPDEGSVLIRGLLERQQICIIGGPPKSMKTWLMLALIRCLLVHGSDFVGIPDLTCIGEGLRLLILEEEGSRSKLQKRARESLKDTEWKSRTHWVHRSGWKLDDDETFIEDEIRRINPDVVFIDPLRRFHDQDENSATDMAKVWKRLQRLTTIFPSISIVILHHTNKSGNISDGWNSLRGSSTAAAEVDLGIFVEKRARSEGRGIKVAFDGRDIEPIENAEGKSVFKLHFDAQKNLTLVTGVVTTSEKHMALLLELRDRGGRWSKSEAVKFFGVSTTTLDNWLKKLEDKVEVIGPAPGRPSILVAKAVDSHKDSD